MNKDKPRKPKQWGHNINVLYGYFINTALKVAYVCMFACRYMIQGFRRLIQGRVDRISPAFWRKRAKVPVSQKMKKKKRKVGFHVTFRHDVTAEVGMSECAHSQHIVTHWAVQEKESTIWLVQIAAPTVCDNLPRCWFRRIDYINYG